MKTNEECHKSLSLAIWFVAAIQVSMCLVSVRLFGEEVVAADSNIMNNINEEFLIDPRSKGSFLLRIMFLVVIGCHIPFIFFYGKESLLIIVDELARRSVSHGLILRLKELKRPQPSMSLPSSKSPSDPKSANSYGLKQSELVMGSRMSASKQTAKISNRDKVIGSGSAEVLDMSAHSDQSLASVERNIDVEVSISNLNLLQIRESLPQYTSFQTFVRTSLMGPIRK